MESDQSADNKYLDNQEQLKIQNLLNIVEQTQK